MELFLPSGKSKYQTDVINLSGIQFSIVSDLKMYQQHPNSQSSLINLVFGTIVFKKAMKVEAKTT